MAACGNSTAPDGSGEDQPSTRSRARESAPTDNIPEQSDEFLGLFNTNATPSKTVLMDESGVNNAYDSLLVNGYMTDYSYYSQNLEFDIRLRIFDHHFCVIKLIDCVKMKPIFSCLCLQY